MHPNLSHKLSSDCTLHERLSALEQTLYGSLSATPIRSSSYTSPGQPIALGNSSPLGLLGFATASLVTAVMKVTSSSTAGTSGTFATTAIFLGGLAQVLTAVFQLLQNNTHAATAFGVYGFHWLAVGTQLWVASVDTQAFLHPHEALPAAAYSGVLAAMTVLLFLPTLRMNAMLSSLFLTILVVFLTEIPAAYGFRSAEVASGVVQGIAGALGGYLAVLDLINETWRRPVLPLFPYKEYREEYEDAFDEVYVPRKCYYKSAVSSIHT